MPSVLVDAKLEIPISLWNLNFLRTEQKFHLGTAIEIEQIIEETESSLEFQVKKYRKWSK